MEDDGCMGRSSGALISKIHALFATEGRPVCLRLTAGQDADCTKAEALISTLSEGDILLADKGYDSDVICAQAKQRKSWANIPLKANRKATFASSVWLYRRRDLAKRFFNRIKRCRGIATSYGKHPDNLPRRSKFVAARIGDQT